MSTKSWITGALVALAGAAGYLAHCVTGTPVPESPFGLSCAPAVAILEQKKRCGFADLGQLIEIEGTVIKSKFHNDGDRSVDVIPDPEYGWVLWYGGFRNRDYIHVEFMPCERTYVDVESVLGEVHRRYEEGTPTRVSILGRWAYDGVDHRGDWETQLETCLDGRAPDPTVGWTEIHPAYAVEILEHNPF